MKLVPIAFAASVLAFAASIGFMAGLAVSPVVASLVGFMAPVAVGLVAWKSEGSGSQPAASGQQLAFFALILGPLGVGLLLGIGSGIYARSHQIFSPSLADRVDEWTTAGFEKREALALIANASTKPQAEHSGGLGPSPTDTVLFGAHGNKMNPTRYHEIFAGHDLSSMLEAYRAFGAAGEKVAARIEGLKLPDEEKIQVARTVWSFLEENAP